MIEKGKYFMKKYKYISIKWKKEIVDWSSRFSYSRENHNLERDHLIPRFCLKTCIFYEKNSLIYRTIPICYEWKQYTAFSCRLLHVDQSSSWASSWQPTRNERFLNQSLDGVDKEPSDEKNRKKRKKKTTARLARGEPRKQKTFASKRIFFRRGVPRFGRIHFLFFCIYPFPPLPTASISKFRRPCGEEMLRGWTPKKTQQERAFSF